MEIPSLEITELGMTGFNAAANRTAIGLAVNLPQFRYNDTYQVQNNLTQVRGNHSVQGRPRRAATSTSRASSSRPFAGCCDTRRSTRSSNDVAEAANINKPLPGGEDVNYYRWWDQYVLRAGRLAHRLEPHAESRRCATSCPATTSGA